MSDIKIVDDFLERAEVFYLATTKGDQPKCRPFGYHYLDGDKIYFTSGTFKDVFKQIQENPKVEIAAYDGDKFLRYYGTAKIVKNDKIVQRAFDELPEVGKIFKEMGLELGVFYIDNATAEIRNQLEVEITYKFEYE
ncbi:pyridoxamine 5'-phosphate oxidase family protein [uncultured Methanobrevibacter sp.]|uniref:pyridoxamine 5'-phosphate oxidase family protein n=1 Tax=uncultured Methanobrevibacter sp. TaxID=253161 RepID=UPI0026165B8C|nr:pyridoxamine 5'-phosphate oxidase family protein [uncultured Methanobrevibacter sp.]